MILKEIQRLYLLFSSIFLTILQIFSTEVTLICDQILINISAYGPEEQLMDKSLPCFAHPHVLYSCSLPNVQFKG